MTKTKQLMPRLLLMIVLPLLLVLFKPTVVHAHDSYFLQVLLDESSMTFVTTAENDKISIWATELNHKEIQAGNYIPLITDRAFDVSKYGDSETRTEEIRDNMATRTNEPPLLVFSFPSKMLPRNIPSLSKNNANGHDSDRAFEISQTLGNSLNQYLIVVFDGSPAPSLDELKLATDALLKATGSGDGAHENAKFKDWELSLSGNDLIMRKGGMKEVIPARMIKGYAYDTLENGKKSQVYRSDYKVTDDVKFISIGMLAAQGVHLNDAYGYDTSTNPEFSNQSAITLKLNTLLYEILGSLRNALGLKSIENMVFAHNSAGTFGGIMPNKWLAVATSFHLVFQAIAWSLITIAIVKILIQNNLATINVYSRISMIESIKKLLMTAGLLGTSFLIISVLVSLNSQIVSIFSSMAGDNPMGAALNNTGNIGGTILNFFYFIVTIYLNFIYIMRGLTVAVLIASAPLFIVSIAFSTSESKIFSTWSKELVSNIFLQSFQAFVFAMALSLSASSTGIEYAVVTFALIPLSDFFRNVITGGDTLSSRLSHGAASGVVMAGAGLASGAMMLNRMNKGKAGGFGGGGGKEGSPNGLNNEQGVATEPNTFNNLEASQSTMGKMNQTSSDKGQESNPNNIVSNDYSAHSSTGPISPTARAGNIAKATTKGILGAGIALAGVGAGFGMATTGVNPKMAAVTAAGVAAGGFSLGKSAVSDMGGTARDLKGEIDNPNINNGNIVHSQTLENGDSEIHRDKAKVLEQEGVTNAYQTSEGNQAISYDMDNVKKGSETDINVGFIADNFNADTSTYFNRRGVENVTRDGQNPKLVTVHYNEDGAKNLGIKSMSSTARRFKETKAPSNSKTTRFNYDVEKQNVAPIKDEESSHKFVHRG